MQLQVDDELKVGHLVVFFEKQYPGINLCVIYIIISL